jgi:hypothetical protein
MHQMVTHCIRLEVGLQKAFLALALALAAETVK